MIPFGAVVTIRDIPDVQGRVVIRYDYLNGSSHYEVQWWSKTKEETIAVRRHENELTIVDDSETTESPVAPPEFALGAVVRVLPQADRDFIITAHYVSCTGCIEYELFNSLLGGRRVLEPQLLMPTEEESYVATGEMTGSHTREVYSSR